MMRTLLAQPPPSHPSRFGPLLMWLALALSCEQQPRPWSAPPDGKRVIPPRHFLPTAALSDSAGAATAAPSATPPTARRPSRVGGLWVSCYAGFRDSGVPNVDVTRLGLLCGPENGMTPHGPIVQGQLAPAQVATVALQATTGHCYRIFAVASASIDDLNVVLRSPRGSVLARDDSHDGWPIVEPERPFCALEDGTYSVQLSAATAGTFALAIWQLTARGSRSRR